MKHFLVVLTLLFSGCSTMLPEYTVMITNLADTSGGSGSIIATSAASSTVLTNAHVCNVVKHGGHVRGIYNEGLVVQYVVSNLHDLCIIEVSVAFNKSTSLSSFMPTPLDKVTVSGHPHLLPLIMTSGHLSGKKVITILVGWRECTADDLTNSNTLPFCTILGKIPVLKNYESVVTSATIQPGSSGSGVYNSSGKIEAVIFAGEGDFGYGLAVPFEYIYAFLNYELPTLDVRLPNQSQDAPAPDSEKVKAFCSTQVNNPLCTMLQESYNPMIFERKSK